MAKRSKKRPSLNGRNQAGCMRSLISMFYFRQGRSPRRLLSDRSRVTKQSDGSGHSNTKSISHELQGKCQKEDAEENKVPVGNFVKTSVKELMEQEMINELHSKKGSTNSITLFEQVDPNKGWEMKKNHKRRNRFCNKSSDVDVCDLEPDEYLMPEEFDKVPEEKKFDNLDVEVLMEELAKINQRCTICKKHDFHGVDESFDSDAAIIKESIIDALNRRISLSNHFGEGQSCCSKEFQDWLLTSCSNKDIFFKLLKDPNSMLFKCIHNFDVAQIEKDVASDAPLWSNLSEKKPINSQPDRKYRGFFRRRSKDLETYQSTGEKNDLCSSNIVILKPGPAVDISKMFSHKASHERNMSQFSFNEIKRKLRHAIGKERQGISPERLIASRSSKHQNGSNSDKGATGEIFSWSSPNRNHFFTERFAKIPSVTKMGEEAGKLKENGSVMASEPCQHTRLGVSNIYIEAKKHLSRILRSADENPESMTEDLRKSLGRILSLSDYNSSPCCSPSKHDGEIFVTARMRLSSHGILTNTKSGILNSDNYPSPSRKTSEIQSCNSSDNQQLMGASFIVPARDDQGSSLENPLVIGETIDTEVLNSSPTVGEMEEMAESRMEEERKIHDIYSESFSDSLCEDTQNRDLKVTETAENAPNLRFELDIVEDDQPESSPTVSLAQIPMTEVEASECTPDKMERPSPTSVLEPCLTDYNTSPARTKSQPVEKEIHPLLIHFEDQSPANDQGICTRISQEDEESAFEYVEAVLLGSGLNWDEFLPRWLSSHNILGITLFDEVELFSSRSQQDQKILFDCANEALTEVCGRHFGCFSGISFVKQSIQPVPTGMDLIHQVWGLVEGYQTEHQSPCCLEQLIGRDMSRSGVWLNLQSDILHLGFEMLETIFGDLIEDVLLGLANNVSVPEDSMLQQTC